MPLRAAGILTEPPVSVPMPPGASRAAIALPLPPLDPPGKWVLSYGFLTAPNAELLLVMPNAS